MEMPNQKPSTSASRMRRFREKKKIEDPDFAKRECKRIGEFRKRKREQLSETELAEVRLRERERKRLQRARERIEAKEFSASTETPYMSEEDLSKDVQKAIKALPESPSKQKAVVIELAREMNIALAESTNINTLHITRRRNLSIIVPASSRNTVIQINADA